MNKVLTTLAQPETHAAVQTLTSLIGNLAIAFGAPPEAVTAVGATEAALFTALGAFFPEQAAPAALVPSASAAVAQAQAAAVAGA